MIPILNITKPKHVYALLALNDQQNNDYDHVMESIVYSCGSFIIPSGHYLDKVLFISGNVNCQTPISSQYYSKECRRLEGHKNICFNCLEECEFAEEDESYIINFKSFLPRCENCKAMGKEAFLRKSKISNIKLENY